MTVTGQTIRAGCSAARTPTATRTGTPTYVGISNLATFMTAFATWVRAMLRNNWIAYAGDPDDPEQYQELLRRSPTSKVD